MKTPKPAVPFYFGSHGRELFGCFHEPSQNDGMRKCAVLICQPVGHEYINSHRALRQLAVRLAEAGFPVLRFDYSGCGDSYGEPEQSSLGRWLEDVSTAITALRARTGSSLVCVVGLRLGATLAALCGFSRNDLAGVVLWDPVVNGGNHFKELLSLQKEMLRFRSRPRRRLREMIPTFRAHADRLWALARRVFTDGFHRLHFAVFRWHYEPSSLPCVRKTVMVKLVSRVPGFSTGTACAPSLANFSLCDHSRSGRATEVLGFPVAKLLRAELKDLDLLGIPGKPAPKVLVVQTTQTGDENGLKHHLQAVVEHQKIEAPQIWLPTADGSLLVPARLLQSVVSWVCGLS